MNLNKILPVEIFRIIDDFLYYDLHNETINYRNRQKNIIPDWDYYEGKDKKIKKIKIPEYLRCWRENPDAWFFSKGASTEDKLEYWRSREEKDRITDEISEQLGGYICANDLIQEFTKRGKKHLLKL